MSWRRRRILPISQRSPFRPHPPHAAPPVAVLRLHLRLRPQAVVTADALREWCRSRMASYKVPARIVVVDAFPTTTTGKLARRELKALAADAR